MARYQRSLERLWLLKEPEHTTGLIAWLELVGRRCAQLPVIVLRLRQTLHDDREQGLGRG